MITTTRTYDEILIAGFGGQGVILVGKLLAQAAMVCDLQVTYMPAYGMEVRGGTANCMIVISDQTIPCPLVTNPQTLICLNEASFRKFVPRIPSGGSLILNTSLVHLSPDRDDITTYPLPIDDLALQLDSPKSANMVALGAYLQLRGRIPLETAAENLEQVLAPRYHKTIPANTAALRAGAQAMQSLL